MAGNAWEWVQDWFDEGYYQECRNQGTVKNPQGAASGDNRVMRSGSYTVPEVRLRCSFRDYNYPDYTSPSVGFRIVWEQ
jgi:formylglycine-generating enzyme required for sulfatase activity